MSHARLPFHRVQQWTGEYFIPAALNQVGLHIHLGHGGDPCPVEPDLNPMEEFNPMTVDDDETEQWEEHSQSQSMPCADHATLLCIVDRSGIHDLPVHWCRCAGHLNDDRQLFAMGLFPATFKLIKTAFTFHVLNDFRIENLECKTAALNFYNKLRRMTSNSFPDSVKVSLHSSECPFC